METKDLQTSETAVAPVVAPENELDVKKDLLAALRGLGKDELLALMLEALGEAQKKG